MLLTPNNAYTSHRKRPSVNTIISPHQPHHEPDEVLDEHRRLTEKPVESTDAMRHNNGHDTKTNIAPTIQQLKGTIVKDDMNRGPPLSSELLISSSQGFHGSKDIQLMLI